MANYIDEDTETLENMIDENLADILEDESEYPDVEEDDDGGLFDRWFG